MARSLNPIAASSSIAVRIRDFPDSARRVYRRGPESFTNLSVYAFGLAALWISVNTVLLQLRVLEIADEDQKNSILGAIALVGLVVAALSQPLMGALSDRTSSRWGKRVPYIVAGNLGLLITVPFLGIANSFLSLLIVIALIQLFIHVSQGPANALLIDHVPAHRRGSGAGALNLSRVIGGGLTTVIVMVLMSGSGTGDGPTSWYWISIGLVMTVLALTTLWTFGSLRPKPGHGGVEIEPLVAPPDETIPAASAEDSHAMKGYYWFLIAMAMMVGALTAMQIFALFFLRDKVGLDNPTGAAAALTATIVIGAAIAVYPSGAVSDRFGRMRVLYGAATVIAVSALPMLFVSSVIPVVIIGLFVGVGAGMFLSGGWALITELVPAEGAGKSLGLTAFSTLAGTGLARLSGFGIDALNRQSENLGYDALIIGIVFLLVVAIYPLRQAGLSLSRVRSATSGTRADDSLSTYNS
ncbi:MAG: MFS transporter [Chloroflexi bacterium]|nr:MFS transporter [Chloroflexota bacterium]